MTTIYDQTGRPRFYIAGEHAIYEHGTARLISHTKLWRGPNGGLPAHWIEGGILHPALAGQDFYYPAENDDDARTADS